MIGFFSAGAMGSGGGGGDGYPDLLYSSSGYSSNGTSHGITLPTVASGDLLCIVIGHGGSNASLALPSPWALASSPTGGASPALFYYLVCSGAEGGTTVAATTSVNRSTFHFIYRFAAGTWSGTPTATRGSLVDTATPDPPSVTPSWGSAKTFWIAAFVSQGSGGSVSVYPLPNGNAFQSDSPATNAGYGAACWSKQEVSTLNPGTFTKGATGFSTALTAAIQPAP